MNRRFAGWVLVMAASAPSLARAESATSSPDSPMPVATGTPPPPGPAPPTPPASPAPSTQPARSTAGPLLDEPAAASPAEPAQTPTAAPTLPTHSAPPSTAATATAAPPPQLPLPGHAVVHLVVDYRDAWLETRRFVDGGDFVRTCRAPCDTRLHVEGLEARVTAAGMTTSNVFRFAAGAGAAGVRVDGGSAAARRAGIVALAAGIPIAMAGMALFAKGKLDDDRGLRAGGIVGLSLGGVSIGLSLPLLLLGTTDVKSAKGSLIALGAPSALH